MKIAILAYSTVAGSESVSAYNYYRDRGATISVYYWLGTTTESDVPADVEKHIVEENAIFDDLDGYDLIIRGPVIHPNRIRTDTPVMTIQEVFMQECHVPIIGVTGTKGKGTTCTLITSMLKAAGKKAVLGGNVGVPALDILYEANQGDFAVLELSSFQLQDIKQSPHVAVCLMVVPEHLNWHTDFEEYKQAKANLFRYQKSEDIAIFNSLSDISREIAETSPAQNRFSYGVGETDVNYKAVQSTCYVANDAIHYQNIEIMKVSEVKLRGRHNLENVCAAIATVWPFINKNIEAIRSVVSEFNGLEHRLQLVRELDGVQYFDDSFSTTPETAIAAIKAFDQPKIVILGGSDKESNYEDLADEVVNSGVKHVLAIGDTGQQIATLLHQRGFHSITLGGLTNMVAIVDVAKAIALPGDIVLLSTGCASFGMFENYKDRGNQFTNAVIQL